MPRTFSDTSYIQTAFIDERCDAYLDAKSRHRSFWSQRQNSSVPPLAHLHPVMFLFMVHDSKLPPGSILLRGMVLIVPRYEGALLFMVVHARCSDRDSLSLSLPLRLSFILFVSAKQNILRRKIYLNKRKRVIWRGLFPDKIGARWNICEIKLHLELARIRSFTIINSIAELISAIDSRR